MGNPVSLYGDSVVAQSWATDVQRMRKAKHIEILFRFIRHKVQDGTVQPLDAASKDNFPDGMTKPLVSIKFESFRAMLGIQRIIDITHQKDC